jgi:alkylation response protein AidB-like acyl-CoA dehydrogenase
MIDFSSTPEEEAFRAAVRGWLADNLPAGWGTPHFVRPRDAAAKVAFARRWQRVLHDGGWAGLSWPEEYGGRDLSPLQQLIFNEDLSATEFAHGARRLADARLLNPDPTWRLQRGLALIRRDRPRAIRELERVVATEPDNVTAW